jgi:membrane protein DedA with SNARE-associated domain
VALEDSRVVERRCWQPVSRFCRPRLRPALLLTVVLGLSIGLVVAPIDYRALGNYGYLGVFLVTLIATGAIVVPVPYLAVVIVAGSFLDPLLVALVAGVAAALGELTGYLMGYTGRALLPQSRAYALLERGVTRWGGPVIFVAAVIPNPFFDA